MATLYKAREYEATSIPIADVLRDGQLDIFPEIQSRKFFELRVSGRTLSISAGKFIGFIPLNDRVVIYVEPKMPIGNLVRLLSAGGEITALKTERPYAVRTDTAEPLLRAMSSSLCDLLERVEQEGIAKEYVNLVEGGQTLRGSIRFYESAQRYWTRGKRHYAVSSYFELTADLPHNGLLKYACHSLLMHFVTFGVSDGLIARLAYFEKLFDELGVKSVSDLPLHVDEKGMTPTYARAIRLAAALIHRQGIELPMATADVFLPSLLIDMEAIFEQYVRSVLRDGLSTMSVSAKGEADKSLFDDTTHYPASPDIVIGDGNHPSAVGDMKYKPKHSREDVNQVITYALSYKTDTAFLFLPALSPDDAKATLVGRVRGISLYRCTLWLGSDEMLGEARRFAESVAAILRQ